MSYFIEDNNIVAVHLFLALPPFAILTEIKIASLPNCHVETTIRSDKMLFYVGLIM